jgi:hypothetical protein
MARGYRRVPVTASSWVRDACPSWRVGDRVVAPRCDGAYPGGVPHSAHLPSTRLRARRRVLAELALGLLVGALAGWSAGLLRVPRP